MVSKCYNSTPRLVHASFACVGERVCIGGLYVHLNIPTMIEGFEDAFA